MALAKFLMCTQGKSRNRLLLTTRCKWRARVESSQPIHLSRAWTRHAALEKLQTARHRRRGPVNPDQILEVYAERHFVTERVVAVDQFAEPLPRPCAGDPLHAHRCNISSAPLSGALGPPRCAESQWPIQATSA